VKRRPRPMVRSNHIKIPAPKILSIVGNQGLGQRIYVY
jgi:hypothetical protein